MLFHKVKDELKLGVPSWGAALCLRIYYDVAYYDVTSSDMCSHDICIVLVGTYLSG